MISLILAGLISLKIMPLICFSPCSVRVTLTVAPSELNRKVRLELDGGSYYRESEIDYQTVCWEKVQENGTSKKVCRYPPKTTQITYPDLPIGEYVVRAYLFKQDDKDNEVDAVRIRVAGVE